MGPPPPPWNLHATDSEHCLPVTLLSECKSASLPYTTARRNLPSSLPLSIRHSCDRVFLRLDNQYEGGLAMSLPGKMRLNTLFGYHHLPGLVRLLCLGSKLGRIRLCPQISRCGSGVGEEAGEDGLNERSEQDLGTRGLGKSHPEDKDELEGVVECYYR